MFCVLYWSALQVKNVLISTSLVDSSWQDEVNLLRVWYENTFISVPKPFEETSTRESFGMCCCVSFLMACITYEVSCPFLRPECPEEWMRLNILGWQFWMLKRMKKTQSWQNTILHWAETMSRIFMSRKFFDLAVPLQESQERVTRCSPKALQSAVLWYSFRISSLLLFAAVVTVVLDVQRSEWMGSSCRLVK